MRSLWVMGVLALACAHNLPDRRWQPGSTLQLAPSHRCKGDKCICRDPDQTEAQEEQNPPPPGTKRFELRLGKSLDRVWIEVEGLGMTYKDSTQLAPLCVYVDLPKDRRIRVRYHSEPRMPGSGTVLDLRIAEYGSRGPWWYDTARVECGAPGVSCDKELLQRWLVSVERLPLGLRDSCGSTRIEQVSWSSPESEITALPIFTAELLLHVYKFEPRHASGSPACKGNERRFTTLQ